MSVLIEIDPVEGDSPEQIVKAIQDALQINGVRVANGIKAKALRKKGTDLWYCPEIFTKKIPVKTLPKLLVYTVDANIIEQAYEIKMPSDAELVNILILEDK